ncbi:MAG: hypothetical protein M1813_004206 [Trichoglossum hirsutum]|nr:MAG: hypothetical protein M1813_004206 [Trichoglossum hirsutum]
MVKLNPFKRDKETRLSKPEEVDEEIPRTIAASKPNNTQDIQPYAIGGEMAQPSPFNGGRPIVAIENQRGAELRIPTVP